jgi:DNA-binding MarR family transcriptional regulator
MRAEAEQEAPPSPDEGHYHARPANLLRRVHQTSAQLFTQALADPDMTQPRFEALVAIEKYPGRDQITLARGLGIDRSTTTLVLDGLAAKGWIERTIQPSDRRKRVLHVTASGRQTLQAARAHADAAEARLLSPFSRRETDGLTAAMIRLVTTVPSSAPAFAGMVEGEVDAWAPRHVAFLVRRCVQVAHALLADAGRPLELTPQQFGILYILALAPCDEAEVSRRVNVERSAVEKALRRLKLRGLVERPCETLRLTTAGKEAFHTMCGLARAADRVLLDSLTAGQRNDFIGGLLKLVDHHKA